MNDLYFYLFLLVVALPLLVVLIAMLGVFGGPPDLSGGEDEHAAPYAPPKRTGGGWTHYAPPSAPWHRGKR